MWLDVLTAIRQEFSDLPSLVDFVRVTLTLGMALLLGGAIGFERELHGSPAGLRTHMLVALGSAVFTLVPREAGMSLSELSRVLQGLVTGVGFLGAGAIVKYARLQQVHGLTTAASLWMAAGIGMTVGMGREATAVLTTAMVVAVLAVLPRLDRRLARHRRAAVEAQRAQDTAARGHHGHPNPPGG